MTHTQYVSGHGAAGVVGGSVAWGHGAREVGVTDFAALFFTHIKVGDPTPEKPLPASMLPEICTATMSVQIKLASLLHLCA